ncbi:MAG: YegP family protein [Bacteroidota bacterium]
MIQILKSDPGGYRFYIKSKSGHSLMVSRTFDTKIQAEDVLRAAQRNPIFERKTNHEGNFLIHLKGSDGSKVAESKTYTSEAGMENGIKNVKHCLSQSGGF